MPTMFKLSATWEFVCYDKQGNVKWREKIKNLVVEEGLDHVLDVAFHGATQITAWYVALYESDNDPAAGNTYASPGVTECTAYSQATRPAYNESAPVAQTITNSSSKASFSINDSKTIYGGMLVGGGTGAATKGDAAGGGTLFCQSRIDPTRSVISGDTLDVTVEISSSAA